MASSLLPQLLGLGGDTSEDPALASLIFGALQLIILGAIIWFTVQNCYRICTWFIGWLIVTAKFESNNETYAWMQSWVTAQPEYSNFRMVQVLSAHRREDGVGWFLHYMELDTTRTYWTRPVDGSWMFCRFNGVRVIVIFRDPTNNSDGVRRPAVMIVKLLTLNGDHLRLLLEEAKTMHDNAREGLPVDA